MKRDFKLKNYTKEGQKLPLFGVGPYLIYGIGALTLIGIVLSQTILKSGNLSGVWIYVFRIVGIILIILGIIVWAIGALGSDMDEHIADNKLKTDGIYGWVRNPMYSGLWMLITGISLMCHNAWLLILSPINWLIMTVVLKNTEEKWLLDLYGEEYSDYIKRVNRCIPWKR